MLIEKHSSEGILVEEIDKKSIAILTSLGNWFWFIFHHWSELISASQVSNKRYTWNSSISFTYCHLNTCDVIEFSLSKFLLGIKFEFKE